MSATKSTITNHEINNLLRAAAGELPGAQPRTIALRVLGLIPEEDKEDVLLILLENQMGRVFSYDRAPVPSRSVRSNSIAAVRDSGIDPVELDRQSNPFTPMAHRIWARSKARNITQGEAREQILIEDEVWRKKNEERMRESVRELAEINRKADIADALNRRVKIKGTYKMLLDCTLEEVEWLAENATNVAVGHIHAAAFYTDIANRMRESGATIAGQILKEAA